MYPHSVAARRVGAAAHAEARAADWSLGFDHGPVPMCAQRTHQQVHLGWGQHPRQRARRAYEWDRGVAPADGWPGRGYWVDLEGRVTTRQQVGEQPRDAAQPARDGARRESRLSVLETHDLGFLIRGALSLEEGADVCPGDLVGILLDDAEEDLEVEGDGEQVSRYMVCVTSPSGRFVLVDLGRHADRGVPLCRP